MGQVVDTDTAREFMKETLAKVDLEDLSGICSDLEAKSARFRESLSPDAIGKLDPGAFRSLLRLVFSTRGKTRKTLDDLGFDEMRTWIRKLLYDPSDISSRFQRFVDRLAGVPDNVRADLASELLHFTDPDRHWLWTRWLWDPRTKTGSLPLVTTAAYDLSGTHPGEIYMKVGRATAFVHEVGEAAGFQKISRSVFGTDVFLCCVYVVYAYTVLRMRMTQEFNKVMPGLPEFCRRLLGVHRKKSKVAAPSES